MLRVRVLGDLTIEVNGSVVEPPASRRARALLGWLTVERRMHPRSTLAARFWPDVLDESARTSLRSALSALRRALGPGSDRYLIAGRDEVGLADESLVWTDLAEFQRCLAEERLEEALALSRGELLAGLDDDWVYELRDEQRARAPLPVATGALAAVAHDGRIYAVGGFNQAGRALASLWIYHPRTNKWTTGAPMPTARGLESISWSDDRLYAIGGRSSNFTALRAVEAYNPHTNQWQRRAPIPIPRSLAAMGTLADGRIVAAGGSANGKPPMSLSDVEVYTPLTNSWKRFTRLPEPRSALAGAVIGGNVFLAIGGFVAPHDQASALVQSAVVPPK